MRKRAHSERVRGLLESRSENRSRLARASSVEELDADAAEGLPEAHVKLELHARLISMKHMGQLDRDRSVRGDFGTAVMSG